VVPPQSRRPLAAALAALGAAVLTVLAISAGATGAADRGERGADSPSIVVSESTGPTDQRADETITPSDAASPSDTAAPAGTAPSSPPSPSDAPSPSDTAVPSDTADPSGTAIPSDTAVPSDSAVPGPTPTATADLTPPVIEPRLAGARGHGDWFRSAVTVTWSVTDPESTAVAGEGCSPAVVTDDTPLTTITCQATSAGGAAEANVSVSIDTAPPSIQCPEPAPQFIVASQPQLSAAVTDATSGPQQPAVTVAVPADAAGPALVPVTAQDTAGNTATVICQAQIVPDPTGPVIGDPIVNGQQGADGWYAGEVVVQFPVSDPESPVASQVGCGPEPVSGEGATVTVTCTATSGGGATTRSLTLARDATPPVLACPAPLAFVQGAGGSVTASVTDALSGPAVASVSLWVDTSVIGAGSMTLSATDLAGNTGVVACGYEVVPDPTAPVVTYSVEGPTTEAEGLPMSRTAGAPWYTGDVTVRFAVSEPESIILSRTGCATTVITEDTTGTLVPCTVSSYGEGGRAEEAAVFIRRDATPPVVSCGPAPVVVQGNAVEVSASFADATSGPVSEGETRQILETSAVGDFAVVISTRDLAGNLGEAQCGYQVIPDRSRPLVITEVDGESRAPGWYSGDVTVRFGITEAESPIISREGCDEVAVPRDAMAFVVTCRVTSYGGTTETSVTVSTDSTAPVISCPRQRFVQGMSGKATADIEDATSGVESKSISAPADTSIPGLRSVVFTTTDRAGNDAKRMCHYRVLEPQKVSATRLSKTGSNVIPLVLTGAVLAVAGTALALSARRRSSDPRHRA
jgi:hypothetical protein